MTVEPYPNQTPLPAATDEWSKPRPQHIPRPSFWPLALAVLFLLWGLISTLILTGAGAALLAIALTGWIQEIRHERRTDETH